jgi:hypothetical protein
MNFWREEVNGDFLETVWEMVKTAKNYPGGGVTAEVLAEFFRRTTSVDNKKVIGFLKRVWDNYDALSVSKDNTDIIKEHAGTTDARWLEEIESGRLFENLREIYRTIRDTSREYDNPENREQKKLLDMFIGNHVGLEEFVRGDMKFDAASPRFKGLMTGLAGGAPSPTVSALLFLKWCNTLSAASGGLGAVRCCARYAAARGSGRGASRATVGFGARRMTLMKPPEAAGLSLPGSPRYRDALWNSRRLPRLKTGKVRLGRCEIRHQTVQNSGVSR